MDININPKDLNAYSTGLLQGIAYRVLNDNLTTGLSEFGLSVAEWKLLGQLYEQGKMSLDQLSKILGIEPPLTTRIIYKLQTEGFVEKVINEVDKRQKIVSISGNGKEIIIAAEAPIKKEMKMLLEGTTRDELLTYIKILATIVNNSNKHYSNNSFLKGGE